jgi:hypothetical protein
MPGRRWGDWEVTQRIGLAYISEAPPSSLLASFDAAAFLQSTVAHVAISSTVSLYAQYHNDYMVL